MSRAACLFFAFLSGFLYATEDVCDYSSIKGSEFTFVRKDESLQQYRYLSWALTPDVSMVGLPYSRYVDLKGKLIGKVGSGEYTKAILENCENVFYWNSSGVEQNYFDGVYFASELSEAKNLIGKNIWVTGGFELITKEASISYELNNIEKVSVVDVELVQYGHAFGRAPFFLKIKKNNGQVGFFPFNKDYFYEKSPIPAKTSSRFIKAIEKSKVLIGMPKNLVLLSWGKPGKINSTVGKGYSHEQWVYDARYLYFTNGILDSFQSSD